MSHQVWHVSQRAWSGAVDQRARTGLYPQLSAPE